jgi:predicted glycosyltransferase
MAGYNTTAEILSVGTPALLVPRSGPSAEQQMRARLFAERGWVDWLPPAGLSAETLGRAVVDALDARWTMTPVRPPDLAGRTTGTQRLIESFDQAGSPLLTAVGLPDDDYLLA